MVTKASVDAVLDKIDGLVGAEMDHFGTPGVAVSVVYDDVVLFSTPATSRSRISTRTAAACPACPATPSNTSATPATRSSPASR
jgi:hypothetical protein